MALSKVDLANQVENQLPQNLVANNVNFRNIIINGDMSIAQRGTSATGLGTGTNNIYLIDRFKFVYAGSPTGRFTMTQDTDVPTGQGFAKSLKLDCTTAQVSPASGDAFYLVQEFEGQNLQYLKKGTSSAKSLTISFWVKSVKTGNYVVDLYDGDNTRIIGNTYTINSANTWEKKTITFAGDTTGALDNDNLSSLRVWFVLTAGSSFTGTDNTSWGTYATGKFGYNQTVNLADDTANNFWITGVQLEAGTTASDFEFLPYDVNLERCSRYFYRHNSQNFYDALFMASMYTSSVGYGSYKFHKPMRAAPTFSSSGTFATVANSSVINCTFSTEAASTHSIFIKPSLSSTRTGGQAIAVRVQNDINAYLQFDAEL